MYINSAHLLSRLAVILEIQNQENTVKFTFKFTFTY
jgi:hypothetical protein